MFIVFFFVLLLSNKLYKINSLSIINLLDNNKEYGNYEKFRKILVKRNNNNFAVEYIDSDDVNTFDFGKFFTVNSCMKILCNENASGRPPKKDIKELKEKLSAFYNSDYKPLIKDTDLNYTHLNTVLDYITIGIITIYENNIKLHYVEYVERYVNIVWKKKETIVKIKEENKKN